MVVIERERTVRSVLNGPSVLFLSQPLRSHHDHTGSSEKETISNQGYQYSLPTFSFMEHNLPTKILHRSEKETNDFKLKPPIFSADIISGT